MSTVALGMPGIRKMNSTGEGMPLVCARYYSAATNGTAGGAGDVFINMVTTDYDEYNLAIRGTDNTVYGVKIPTTGFYRVNAQVFGTVVSSSAFLYFGFKIRKSGDDASPVTVTAAYDYFNLGDVKSISCSGTYYLKAGIQILPFLGRQSGTGALSISQNNFSYFEIQQITQDQMGYVPSTAI